MAKKTGSVGAIREGIVVGDSITNSGYVAYSDAKDLKTPNVSQASVVKGTSRGMGLAIQGGKFKVC